MLGHTDLGPGVNSLTKRKKFMNLALKKIWLKGSRYWLLPVPLMTGRVEYLDYKTKLEWNDNDIY